LAANESIPRSRSQVAQLVYVAVGCVALYMVKVLLSVRAFSSATTPRLRSEGPVRAQTLIMVASATLGIVCLSRWLVYNGTVGTRRVNDRCSAFSFVSPVIFGADASRNSDAAQRGRWPPGTDERPRHGAEC
jgi:hypothetical protein